MAGSAFTHDSLIQAFERRFDHLSARTMAAEVLARAGVTQGTTYDPAALARIAKTVESMVQRPDPILGSLDAPAPAAEIKAPAKDEKKAEDKPAKVEAKPAEAKAADASPEAEPPADKPADKPAEKPAESKKK